MKLQLTIPQRPKLIHILPVVDLIAVVFALPLVVKSFAPQGGQQVVTPDYRLRIPSFENATIIEMVESDGLQMWLGKEKLTFVTAKEMLIEEQEKWTHGGAPVILLKMDKHISNMHRSQMINLLMEMKFDVYEVGGLR